MRFSGIEGLLFFLLVFIIIIIIIIPRISWNKMFQFLECICYPMWLVLIWVVSFTQKVLQLDVLYWMLIRYLDRNVIISIPKHNPKSKPKFQNVLISDGEGKSIIALFSVFSNFQGIMINWTFELVFIGCHKVPKDLNLRSE